MPTDLNPFTNDMLHRASKAYGVFEWPQQCAVAPLEEYRELGAEESVRIIEASREVMALQKEMQQDFEAIMKKYGLPDWMAVISVVSKR